MTRNSPESVNGKIQRTILEALAFAGLVVLDRQTLLTLTHERRASHASTSGAFVWADVQRFLSSVPGVTLREVRFVGSEDWVAVATRSDHALSDRIRWVTGKDVAAARQYHGDGHSKSINRQAVAPFVAPGSPEERGVA